MKLLPLMSIWTPKFRVPCQIQCILKALNSESAVPQSAWNILNERRCYCHLRAKTNNSQKALRSIFRTFFHLQPNKTDWYIRRQRLSIWNSVYGVMVYLCALVNPSCSPLLQSKVRGLVKARAWLSQRDYSRDRKIWLTVTEVQWLNFLELGIRVTLFSYVVQQRTT